MRVVSVLQVAAPALWDQLEAVLPLVEHLAEPLGPLRRVVRPSFESEALPELQARGLPVLLRYARRSAAAVAAGREDLARQVDQLPLDTRRVLHAAQRHALGGVVHGIHAWDVQEDRSAVRVLHRLGLLRVLSGETYAGRYQLHEDLPPPPAFPYDFGEALMPKPEDLAPAGQGALALLHDMAALAAALAHVMPRRTLRGDLGRADARRLGRRLGVVDLARDGRFQDQPRWTRALRALELLGVVGMDPIERRLGLDLGLERILAGSSAQAIDGLVCRLADRDLHVGLPALREALRQAGEQALDEVIFLELLREQHRELVFPAWQRQGVRVYPTLEGEALREFDERGWERVEAPMLRRLLERVERLGLVRRAPGVFAASADGRVWAAGRQGQRPPVWLTSDLELVVPPGAVTPWERFQLERLGRCLARDVADRYRLEREGLVQWLAFHELEEALALLERRCVGIPATVRDSLRAWAVEAERIVLTRGVLLDD